MSSPLPLTARQSLELLGELRVRIARVAEEEERSLGELQKRRATLQRKYRDALARAGLEREARQEHETAYWSTFEEHARVRHAARRARIQHAYRASMQKLQARAQRAKEKFLGDLQMRHFRAERQRPEELKKLEREHVTTMGFIEEEMAKLAGREQRVLRALQGLPRLRRQVWAEAAQSAGETDGSDWDERAQEADEKVSRLQQLQLLKVLRFLPAPLLGGAILLLAGAVALLGGGKPAALGTAAAVAVVLGVALMVVHRMAQAQAGGPSREAAAALIAARRSLEAFSSSLVAAHELAKEEIDQRFARELAEVESKWPLADDVGTRFSKKTRDKLERQVLRLMGRHDRLLEPLVAAGQEERARRRTLGESEGEAQSAGLAAAQERELGGLAAEENVRWEPLEQRWHAEVLPLYRQLAEAGASGNGATPHVPAAEDWQPPAAFAASIPFGRLALDLAPTPKQFPTDPRLALPGPSHLELPLALVYPEQGSLLIETPDSGEPRVVETLNQVILRMFSSVPAGKLSVTIIDPVGLGQNFAGLMTLGDYEESLINRRIWTQREQIDERLAELNEHIEKMIQMYLRDEFATISEYNTKAGSVAEKYHLLVIADFPASFSETAAKRLQSIAVSGPRCGVFTLIHWDTRQGAPDGLVPDELRKRSVTIRRAGGELVIDPAQNPAGVKLLLDAPLEPAAATALIHRIGKSSVDSNRVEVPFAQIAPPPDGEWTSETTQELRVPIGRTGATKLQYLAIGKGTRQHALFAGKTGSGKSTLFHVIITNLALWCSPAEVEFYLIDFKKGVEFKCYATQRLPHARVVAIESDREFALSVLQRVDEELRRRGDLFRALGVQDVAGYKRSGGAEPMPRSLLMIDEFQEFFVEDDPTAQSAALLFDRIVRQGRAFGIHVLLGSQTLGGAYTLARATLGQMAIRVALQCNEADAYLIMDDNNAAPRLLSRPGEGIYNDAAGAVEGNSPFQVVWLSDAERDRRLVQIRELAEARHWPARTPVVFEGNAPADLRENDLLSAVLSVPPGQAPVTGRIWLGAPNAIKGPTEVKFRRQSGNHLLIAGQREETAVTMLAVGLVELAAQYPAGGARFYFLASAAPGSPEMESIERAVEAARRVHGSGQPVTLVRGGEVAPAMGELAAELKTRANGAEETSAGAIAPPIFVFIQGLQRFKKLRHEDDFSFSSSDEGASTPGAQLNEIITDGSSVGIHLAIAVDTLSNVQRWLNRKAIGEFELRVLFQMSANDSASLIDSPQASGLGLHRALLYNEQEGSTETFRPYAMPDAEWFRTAGRP